MEIALIILIIAGATILVMSRFKNLVRNDFYLEKAVLENANHCKVNDEVNILNCENDRKICVYFHDVMIGYIPEDYVKIVKRYLREKEELKGKIVKITNAGIKIHVDMKGQVGDIVS